MWKIFWFEIELGQHILHGNAFAAALSKPGLAFVKAPAVLFGDGLIVGEKGTDAITSGSEGTVILMENASVPFSSPFSSLTRALKSASFLETKLMVW